MCVFIASSLLACSPLRQNINCTLVTLCVLHSTFHIFHFPIFLFPLSLMLFYTGKDVFFWLWNMWDYPVPHFIQKYVFLFGLGWMSMNFLNCPRPKSNFSLFQLLKVNPTNSTRLTGLLQKITLEKYLHFLHDLKSRNFGSFLFRPLSYLKSNSETFFFASMHNLINVQWSLNRNNKPKQDAYYESIYTYL